MLGLDRLRRLGSRDNKNNNTSKSNENNNNNNNANNNNPFNNDTSPNNSDDSDENNTNTNDPYEDGELEDILANMDIEKDFNMFQSFRSSCHIRNSSSNHRSTTAAAASAISEDEEDDDDDDGFASENHDDNEEELRRIEEQWKERYVRNEVYSTYYKPNDKETKELNDLALFLGVADKKKKRFPNLFFRDNSNASNNNNHSASERSNQSNHSNHDGNNCNSLPVHQQWEQLTQPSQSIVLKRGPVLLHNAATQENEECELILLTKGFIIAKVMDTIQKFIPRTFYSSELWTNVTKVVPDNLENEFSLRLENYSYQFLSASTMQQTGWMQAIERIIVKAFTPLVMKDNCHIPYQQGWQYQLVQVPFFAQAVIGKNENLTATNEQMKNQTASYAMSQLNKLDEYNSYAPLHYATRNSHNEIISYLLEMGANVNLEDGDGKTAMYYAQHDELSHGILQLLESHGGTKSQDFEIEKRGELFGKTAQAEQERQERIRLEQRDKEIQEQIKYNEQQNKLNAAKSAMNENMAAINERGEKINELGNKATDLYDGAANYSKMAKQLKAEMKKKKWYQL